MEPATPIRISASGIRAYQSCPYKYALDYVEKLPKEEREPIIAFAFGDAVHKAVAQFIRLGGWKAKSLDDLVALLMRHWDNSVYPDDQVAFEQFTRAREMLEVFYFNPYPSEVARELEVEAFVSWAGYRKGILATGRFDRTCLLPDGTLEVIDYKTGKCRQTAQELERDAQALFYRTLAADSYRGLAPSAIKVTFLFLDGFTPVSVEYCQADFLAHWSGIESVVSEIRRDRRHYERGLDLYEAFPPYRGNQCSSCAMRRHCERIAPLAEAKIIAFPM